MLAIIKTGGKQYLVEPGKKIRIEKIEGKDGKEISFKEVLILEKGNKLEIGEPKVSGASVTAKILSQKKAEKVIVFRYKSKTRRRIKKGHRQPFTEVEIKGIETK
ncbi:MAG: 50S ribosomal protein L21 [Candidatus Nealsonbacteria bacterium]|nr:50S ribosomal protein L21 [Candidatus Nealsonbacteria bacterium]